MLNGPLIASFRERGVRQEDFAEAISSSRAHVCQVLNGVAGRGGRTRKKLAPLLTERERALLGWTADGQLFPVECSNSQKSWNG